jgi:hypothetical protein
MEAVGLLGNSYPNELISHPEAGLSRERRQELQLGLIKSTQMLIGYKKGEVTLHPKVTETIGLSPTGKLPPPLETQVVENALMGNVQQLHKIQTFNRPTGEMEAIFRSTVIQVLMEVPALIELQPDRLASLDAYIELITKLASREALAQLVPLTKFKDVSLKLILLNETINGAQATEWILPESEVPENINSMRQEMTRNINGIRMSGNITGTWVNVCEDMRAKFQEERRVMEAGEWKVVLPFHATNEVISLESWQRERGYNPRHNLHVIKEPWVYLPLDGNSRDPFMVTDQGHQNGK